MANFEALYLHENKKERKCESAHPMKECQA